MLCTVVIAGSVLELANDEDDVPNSTRELEASFVDHLTVADVVEGVATTDEITGFTVSVVVDVFRTTVAVPYFVVFAVLVARTVTVCRVVTEEGALYRPVDEMLPSVGLIDHATPVFVVPVTVAVN